MRYFLVSYIAESRTQTATGNCTVVGGDFPNNEAVKRAASDNIIASGYTTITPGAVVIMNIFEFKDKNDYDSYICEVIS